MSHYDSLHIDLITEINKKLDEIKNINVSPESCRSRKRPSSDSNRIITKRARNDYVESYSSINDSISHLHSSYPTHLTNRANTPISPIKYQPNAPNDLSTSTHTTNHIQHDVITSDTCPTNIPIEYKQQSVISTPKVTTSPTNQPTIIPSKLKRCGRKFPLPKLAIGIMNSWYEANVEHPYPSYAACEILACKGNVTVEQVKKWFANRRLRERNTKTLAQIALRRVRHV